MPPDIKILLNNAEIDARVVDYEWTRAMNAPATARLALAQPMPPEIDRLTGAGFPRTRIKVSVDGVYPYPDWETSVFAGWRMRGITQGEVSGALTYALADEWTSGAISRIKRWFAPGNVEGGWLRNPLRTLRSGPHYQAGELFGASLTIDDYDMSGEHLYISDLVLADIERQKSPTLQRVVSVLNEWNFNTDLKTLYNSEGHDDSGSQTRRALARISTASYREDVENARNAYIYRIVAGEYIQGEESTVKLYPSTAQTNAAPDDILRIGSYASVGMLDAKEYLTRSILRWKAYAGRFVIPYADALEIALFDIITIPRDYLSVAPLSGWRVDAITYQPLRGTATLVVSGGGGARH